MNYQPEFIAAIAAVIAIIISVITFIIQTRSQIRHIKAQVSAELTARLNDSNAYEIGHPQLYSFFEQPFEKQTPENHSMVTLTDIRFALLEEVFMQHHKYKLLDNEDWKTWREMLKRWVNRPFFLGYWRIARPYFRPSFINEVDCILGELTSKHNEIKTLEKRPIVEEVNSDPAALSAAIAAGAIAVLIAPGPYGLFSLIIGITLLTVILSYEWERQRTSLQSVAISLVLAFSSLLVSGFILEYFCGGFSLKGFVNLKGNLESAVPDFYIAIAWGISLLIFYTIEKRCQKAKNNCSS